NRVASLYKVFGDRESKSRALFLFNFKNSFFRQLFGEISVTDNGYFALLGDGTVMSFQDSSNPYRISPEVLNTIEANQNTPGNMVFQAANGKRYFAVWESLQLGHWKLAAIVPESDLVRPVNSVTLITVVCSLFAIGAALILSLLVIRLISVPIKNWTGKIEKISSTGTENPDILLDDAVCTEMLEFNRGITELMSRVKQLGKEKLLEEEQKRKLAIRVMSEQIKPHFLYNALHLIEQLGNMGEYKKMTEIVTALSGFYRLSLSRGRELIELKDEIAHAQNYLYIQMIQNKRLFCKIEADEEFSGVKVVKLSLQPILENAVIHGMKHAEDLHLNIKIEGADNSVKIIISDDGMGIPGNKLDALCRAFETNDWSALPEVFGIRNVHERLRLHYGSPYGVSIESAFEEGTKVTILIPGSQS
ncbi:MAG: histidine kinase, partial [Treponema sp.]|nr:histidine kinase [Treponema sp.]